MGNKIRHERWVARLDVVLGMLLKGKCLNICEAFEGELWLARPIDLQFSASFMVLGIWMHEYELWTKRNSSDHQGRDTSRAPCP